MAKSDNNKKNAPPKIVGDFNIARKNPFIDKGKPDIDKYIEFVTQFNAFMGHKKKKFKKIEGEFKL